MPSSRWSELNLVLFSKPTVLPSRSRNRRSASENCAAAVDEVGSKITEPMTTSSVLVQDHAADVLPVQQVLVALVDLLELVAPGDQLIQLEVARPVDVQEPGDGGERVRGPEE